MTTELLIKDGDWAQRYSAWQCAWPVASFDADAFRRDDYGTLINWNAYGDRLSPWGWEIDRGAGETLRALHWRTSRRLEMDPPARS